MKVKSAFFLLALLLVFNLLELRSQMEVVVKCLSETNINKKNVVVGSPF